MELVVPGIFCNSFMFCLEGSPCFDCLHNVYELFTIMDMKFDDDNDDDDDDEESSVTITQVFKAKL